MKIKTFAFAVIASLALLAPALAQFQPTPSTKSFRPTYQATIVGLVTASPATDFLTINGSASKVVTVLNAECYGSAGTAGTADILLFRRSTANLTGTSTAPVAVSMDTGSPVATAAVRAYTVNPGTLGTTTGPFRSAKLALPVPATGAVLQRLQFLFGDGPGEQGVVLRGVAQTLALNGNAAALGAGAAISCSFTWTES